jgi:hypothetical protein
LEAGFSILQAVFGLLGGAMLLAGISTDFFRFYVFSAQKAGFLRIF